MADCNGDDRRWVGTRTAMMIVMTAVVMIVMMLI